MFGRESRKSLEGRAASAESAAYETSKALAQANARAERAEAQRDDLAHKYEQPVRVNKVVPGGAFESNRHKH